ncbi:MAG: PIG-L family deacetylase [Planctomycetaceae bacterium]|nr:PIG-L family deacetylase [Planctomycetaceae bacterium]
MSDSPFDVIAVGAHPDDIEIACGGTLAKLVRQGHRVGIIDLTDGEPTPLSSGPEVRLAEARLAAETLGVQDRMTLDLPNRRLFDTFEARVALATQLRKYRPRLVIGLGGKTPTASPDHYQASLVIEAAVFYAKLTKWEEHFAGLPPFIVPRRLECFLGVRTPTEHGTMVVDITDTLETKLAAIACYQSQFSPTKARSLDGIRALAVQQGMSAGFAAGELLACPTQWGTRDLMGLLFGP